MLTPEQTQVSVTEQHEKSCTVSDAGWSSLVARRAHNPKVVGSNPAPATTFKAPIYIGAFLYVAFLILNT